MPIPTPPGGIMNKGRSGDGRGALGHPTGAKGELSRQGGVSNRAASGGSRGNAPNTSTGFGPGGAGGTRRLPGGSNAAPMPAGVASQRRSG